MLLQVGITVSAARRLQNQAWTKRYVVRSGCSELTQRRWRTTGGEA
jgi:hypothetical protein